MQTTISLEPLLDCGEWRTLTKQLVQSSDMRTLLRQRILSELEQGNTITVAVGSDSKQCGQVFRMATVITIHRHHKGGLGFYDYIRKKIKPGIKDKMLQEVCRTINVASDVLMILNESIFDEYYANGRIFFRIQIDINTDPNYGSNIAYKQAVKNLVVAGFAREEIDFKPDCTAAMCVANLIVNAPHS